MTFSLDGAREATHDRLRGQGSYRQVMRAVEAAIRRLQSDAPVAVGMAPGYFSASPFFPCAPLEREEYNLDYQGNVTLCCQLSGYAGGMPGTDVVGNLHEMSLAEAVDRFHQRVARYLVDKRTKVSRGEFERLDHFPCWYCVQYLNKVPGLTRVRHHPWAHALAATWEETSDGDVGSPGATAP